MNPTRREQLSEVELRFRLHSARNANWKKPKNAGSLVLGFERLQFVPCGGASLPVRVRRVRLLSGAHEPMGRAFVGHGLKELARRFHLLLRRWNGGADACIG